MRLAWEGKTRVPGRGRRACADERMWIQSVPDFLGRMKLPTNTGLELEHVARLDGIERGLEIAAGAPKQP